MFFHTSFFYSLVENIYKRNSFFLIGINDNLPMDSIIKKFIKDFAKEKSNYYTFYIKGYITEKWVSGLFSNWKVTLEFIKYMKRSPKVNSKRYKKYLHYLKDVKKRKKNRYFLMNRYYQKIYIKNYLDQY